MLEEGGGLGKYMWAEALIGPPLAGSVVLHGGYGDVPLLCSADE